jgi:hypothetical protein
MAATTPERLRTIEQRFHEARDLPAVEREPFFVARAATMRRSPQTSSRS